MGSSTAGTSRTGLADTAVPSVASRGPLALLRSKTFLRAWRLSVPFAILIALWDLVVVVGNYPVYLFPPPTKVLTTMLNVLASGQLLEHVWESSLRVLLGTGMAMAIGLPLGFAMGINRRVSAYTTPMVTFFQAIPGLAWVPMAILWFGIGYKTVTFIVFMSVFFPILFNTVLGIRTVSETLIHAALTLGANRWQLITEVYIPGALAQIVVGIRLGVAYGWRALVGAEMIGAVSGLGWLIFDSRLQLRTDLVIVGMITLGLIWLALDFIFLRPLEARTVERWGLLR
jgi:NitT/TauT family transport system permease protein/taurine transport system permease protein